MAVYEVDPISRIEGHLGVKVTETDGYVTEADVHGNLWRGFENFLIGRDINDAITFTQRICGVCPVPHGMTSTYAADAVLGYSRNHITFVEDAQGYGVPVKAVYVRNLVLASEFLMSSLTHQYHLVAPSYVQGPPIPPWTPYFNDSDYHPYLLHTDTLPHNTAGYSDDLWSTVIRSYVVALRIRRLTFEAGALFAGRMPMTSCFVGGGVTNNYSDDEWADRCDKFRAVMEEIATFIVKEYVPIFLALGALYPNFDNLANATTLNTYYPALWTAGNKDTAGAPLATNTGWGAGVGNFLAWGAFPAPDATGALTLPGGVHVGGTTLFTAANKAQILDTFAKPGLPVDAPNSVPNNLTEDISRARYGIADMDLEAYGAEFDAEGNMVTAPGTAAYPGDVARTKPNRAKAGSYTYSKAPRWNGQPMEVGPLARLVVAGIYPLGDALNTIDGYLAYTKANTGYAGPATPDGLSLGLDPKMIEADIAVALVRMGLAELWIGGTQVTTLPGTKEAIDAAYTDPNAYIMGVIRNWVVNLQGGLSTMDRLRARALESFVLVQAMIGAVDKTGATLAFGAGDTSGWIGGLKYATGATWKNKPIPAGTFQGWGGTEAPRGALMHQTTIENGKITKYQCIVPTTWNMSPKTGTTRGPIEQAIFGVRYTALEGTFDTQGGVVDGKSGQSGIEPLRVAQSFDPCIACAVH